ncbi:hypothetical protein OC845_006520 [Tilletia horrida]|nr:hypothetical protein OC845_006520 [Tilletia horrida]
MRLSHLAVALTFISGFVRADFFPDSRRCGVERVDHAAEQKTQELIRFYGPVAVTSIATKKVIPVHWHAITSSDGQGAINSTIMHQQISVLNKDYAEAGFHFKLVGSDVTVQDTWFYNLTNEESDDMRAMKSKLRRGGPRSLNLYTVQLSGGLLGFTTLPSWYSDNPINGE